MARIGDSELDVFPLCLGTNTFGWTADADQSFAVLDEYANAGGNFLDTADVYTAWKSGNQGGESEEIIGSWLKGRKRGEFVIATKVGMHRKAAGLSAANVRSSVEGSLSRLGTDYIDLYYAHVFDDSVTLEESVAAFARLQEDGLIREVGVSNFDGAQLRAWVEEAQAQGVRPPVAVEPHYNLVWRKPFETDLLPVVSQFDLGVMPYWALAAGLLTGKYQSTDQIQGARAAAVNKHATPQALQVVQALAEVADEHNVAPASVAIAWLLEQPSVTAPIASASRPDQVPALLEGVSITLSASELERLDNLSAGLGSFKEGKPS